MPRRKAPAVRANREAVDLGPLIGPRVVEGPPAPDGLLPLMTEAWDRFWGSPLAQLVHTDSDLLALRRLWLYYDEAERGIRAYRRVRVVEGSTGQLRLNPALKAIDEDALVKLEDRFGLSPKARLNLGVVLGDAARSLSALADVGPSGDDAESDARLEEVVW